jgi:alkylhydroperoxidase family enzyme
LYAGLKTGLKALDAFFEYLLMVKLMKSKDQQPERHAEKIGQLVDGVLDGPGHSDLKLRHAVEQRAASHAIRTPESNAKVPEALGSYVDKIALHAYKVTDEDIEALRKAGYSEDAIFELTICAALGAGIARLDRGIAALKGEI